MLLAMVSHDLRQPLQIIMAAHDALEVRLIGEPVFQVNTYGGHPVAAAVALRNIEILEAERLADRSAEIGVYLLDGLHGLMSLAVVGDVGGNNAPMHPSIAGAFGTDRPGDRRARPRR
jgi:adenosylmethionine-8-amino-7-oxononanoate aminotransferase